MTLSEAATIATPLTRHLLHIDVLYFLQHFSLPDTVLLLGLLFLPLRCKVRRHSDLALYFTTVRPAPGPAWPGTQWVHTAED